MIASLSGQVQEINSDNIVIEVAGVGLQVFIPLPLRDRLRPGEKIFLFTYLVVREDSLSLYGFDTKEAREYFILLIGVICAARKMRRLTIISGLPLRIRLTVIVC